MQGETVKCRKLTNKLFKKDDIYFVFWIFGV